MTTSATVQKIRAGLLSRAEAVASNGGDVEALDLQIQQDCLRSDKLGLVFDSDARKTTLQGIFQQGSEADDGASPTIQ